MFTINDDLSIYATRGDIVFFAVSADEDGKPYKFQPGDVVRFKLFGKKDAETVLLQRDFPVSEECETVDIFLTKADTKIGDVISKHKDYWYEVVLNDDTLPQTIIGYDEDGAKVFRLFPEGDDIPEFVPDPEDIKVMDDALDMTSTRPVQNQAIARAMVSLRAEFEKTKEDVTTTSENAVKSASAANTAVAVERARIDNFVASPTPGDSELVDIRVGADGVTYASAGTAVRAQGERISGEVDTLADAIYSKIVVTNLFDNRKAVAGYIANDGVVQGAYYHYEMMVRPGDIIRFTYDDLLDTQNGVFYDGGDDLLEAVSSIATNEGAYKEVVVPAMATKIALNLRYPSVFIITRNADYPAEYVPHQVEIPEQIVKYNNVEYIEDYNLYDASRLIDGYINASGGIITEVSDFKHMRVDVASGDVIRYTYEDVFYSQNGGVYDENDVFLCNLTDKSTNFGTYKEYVAGDKASYILINFRITTKNVISRNNRYDTSFDGFKMNASMPSGKYLAKLENMMNTMLATTIKASANKTNYHALFENVCCIGDSLTEGDYGNGLGVHGYNYPRAFANLTGCKVVNLGASGQSAKSWWEIKERKFPAESLDFSKYDCFLILLGQNEGLNGTMSSSDVSNLGYYCRIIEAIKTANPNASIFLLTIPHNIADDANDNTNAIIKSVGVKYGLPVLDLRNSDILTVENISVNQPYDNAMHYGKVGSLHLAMEVKRLMEESIYADLTRYNVIDS